MIFGLHLLLVFLVTNITLSFLMIFHITYGRSPYVSSLTRSPLCLISLLTSAHNLAFLFKESKATTGENLTTFLPAPSLRLTAFFFGCRVPTPPLKMVKPNALSAPPTMLFAPCYFMQACHPPFGLPHSAWPLTFSTFFQPKPSPFPPPTLLCLAHNQHMSTYGFSVAHVTPTFPPRPPTNLLLVPPYVSFSATLPITRVMYALIGTPTAPSFLAMSSSTKPPFPSLQIHHLYLPRHLIFWRTVLTL